MAILLPYIPEYITVHLGRPESDAANVTVPFAEYIKNVASSEIYPTWPENSIRANIIAQITFALNRIYTEYYRGRGYSFDITNSTSIDQSYVYGRDIFDSINNITDEIFNVYMRRENNVEPIFAVYCDGIEVKCRGLSQWGTVTLADSGLNYEEILKQFYGQNIVLVTDAPIQGVTESFSGRDLKVGDAGDDVRIMQIALNRIRRNYPDIQEITADGLYESDTESAVISFQYIFSLPLTGVIDKATWYAILRIFAAVKKLYDINSEGITPDEVSSVFPENLSLGYSGIGVKELQYFLSFIAGFDQAVTPTEIDGIFGENTENSVKSYQNEYGLPVTGIVDRNTWDSIRNTYNNFLNSLPPDYLNGITKPYPGYPIRAGATGPYVLLVQQYLNLISDTFTSITKLREDSVFGNITKSAVTEYQRLFSLEQNGIVGAETYNSIADTYRSLYDNATIGAEQA